MGGMGGMAMAARGGGGGGGGMTMEMMAAAAMANPNMKPGDWICTSCGEHNFAKNKNCRKCGAPSADAGGAMGMMGGMGGGGGGAGNPNFKPGDWMCPNCGNHVFARHESCPKCGQAKPEGVDESASAGMATGPGGIKFLGQVNESQVPKPGDWDCPSCGFLNFARNAQCKKCNGPKPEGAGSGYGGMIVAQPGDWNCAACGDLQFARNTTCRRCGAPKPPIGAEVGRERSPRRG